MTQRAPRVLVVDDEPAIRDVLTALLRDYDVVAVDGDAAEAMMGADFDVVLCDLMMPRITGIELYEKARAEHPELADGFVFLTGGAVSEAERDFLATCGRPTLRKPFRGAALRELIERVRAER